MATTNVKLPAIPTINIFEYKHYYITRDKKSSGKFSLYLFRYEPVSFKRYGEQNMAVYQKYGKTIAYRMYTYQSGQENWVYSTANTAIQEHYEDFAETLLYNNFAMKFGDDYYEKNPMPEDGVTDASEPQFPVIPKVNKYQYKHYYIIQDQTLLQRYHLYLLAYEPTSFEVHGTESIVAYQKYGKTVASRVYTYDIGKTEWTYSTAKNSIMQDRANFSEALVYNNVAIDFEEEHYEENPMPGDDVVALALPEFPEIPNVHDFQYKYYYLKLRT